MTTTPQDPNEVLLDVSVEDGKYRYVQTRSESHVYRHGGRWQDVTGNKMIYCAFAEIEALRERVDSLETELSDTRESHELELGL